MAATELQQMIDVVAKDKGIDPGIVISAIEDAYLAASRKVFKTEEDLRTRFKALPEDLPGLQTIHSDLFAVEEVLGVEGARAQWLSGELNAAVATKKREQVQKVSDAIRGAIEGTKEIEKRILELTHQLAPFEHLAAERAARSPGASR